MAARKDGHRGIVVQVRRTVGSPPEQADLWGEPTERRLSAQRLFHAGASPADSTDSLGVAQFGSADDLGSSGRRFKSSHPDHAERGAPQNRRGSRRKEPSTLLARSRHNHGEQHEYRANDLNALRNKKTDATDDAGAGMKSSVDVKLGRVIETRSRAMAVAETGERRRA